MLWLTLIACRGPTTEAPDTDADATALLVDLSTVPSEDADPFGAVHLHALTSDQLLVGHAGDIALEPIEPWSPRIRHPGSENRLSVGPTDPVQPGSRVGRFATVGDVNGDQVADVLLSESVTVEIPAPDRVLDLAFGDVHGAAGEELVVLSDSGQRLRLSVWSDAAEWLAERDVPAPFPWTTAVHGDLALGDFDGDGQLDVAAGGGGVVFIQLHDQIDEPAAAMFTWSGQRCGWPTGFDLGSALLATPAAAGVDGLRIGNASALVDDRCGRIHHLVSPLGPQ